MKILKSTLALAISATMLVGCNDETTTNNYLPETPETPAQEVRIASFNLSFDRYTYEDLVAEMKLTTVEQTTLVDGWKADTLSDEDKATALKVIQIRNVAAIIQTEKPAVIMMSEFNNDGIGTNNDALIAFRLNYLAVPQNSNSIDQDGTVLEPIAFQYFANYSTNTGKLSGYDLNNDGTVSTQADEGSFGYANDSWGFGEYHGKYAFALLSQYEIDHENTRTFQNFKWKDMPGEINPVIVDCNNNGLTCGDEWYSDAAWENYPLSSKNHVDTPILIPQQDGSTETVHLLMSHPTPPIFNNAAMHNTIHNRAEINFWVDYVAGGEQAAYIYDDKGTTGALAADAKFVVMGDLNADPLKGDGDLTAINALMDHDKVNRLTTFGSLAPASLGGSECLALGECKAANWDTPNPDQVTSTSGLRLDHVVPSVNLTITETGVYWPATFESGRLLVNDERVGNYGNSKDISSDHRMVWIEAEINN